ncbi:hypothetical protein ES332_D02G148000v1 [Gossypium tomentosum]|uniref:Uncharacterized protein n=1 Tax=Gossypium tomentosum TaxID=34277 RepID=A0A5D2LXA3_GOSTO|nr:hypothetical protein ES332_D02G148000v1 [Gossypium tomentosum]
MLNQDILKARVIKYGFNGVLPCYQFSLYFFFLSYFFIHAFKTTSLLS